MTACCYSNSIIIIIIINPISLFDICYSARERVFLLDLTSRQADGEQMPVLTSVEL